MTNEMPAAEAARAMLTVGCYVVLMSVLSAYMYWAALLFMPEIDPIIPAALHAGLDMETAAELGAVCASFCIEKYGTQEHTFTKESFAKRYETAYGPLPALPW